MPTEHTIILSREEAEVVYLGLGEFADHMNRIINGTDRCCQLGSMARGEGPGEQLKSMSYCVEQREIAKHIASDLPTPFEDGSRWEDLPEVE